MKDHSNTGRKRRRGRPPGPSKTDAHEEKILVQATLSAYLWPGIQLKPIVRQIINANGGPRDAGEVRRIYDRCRSLERPPQYDSASDLEARIGTRARIRADSPEWEHAARNGWFPVKVGADGECIIERQLQRILTQEEVEAWAAKEFARMLIGIGPIRCDDALCEGV